MRLLRRSDTSEFSLHSFGDNETIPPYAILSHTWGADTEELTLEDLENGTGENKPGYEKIRFCGEQAGRNNLQYFWIDTCCINKNNYAELSRSINSMFGWYRNATRCYVYMSDVSTKKRKRDESLKGTWELEFRKSRWFTRGWTLQELIAPASVEFFSRERKRLGDKSSLVQQIYEITGIPKAALYGEPLSQFSVNERLSWSNRRETKLKEDKAYSLLGLFDVYIAPLYGEGMASAFKRLTEEIDMLKRCAQDLRLTDPRYDKKRIEETKGGLVEDSYRWILENSDFQQWCSNQQSRLLWIKGDPGKGKTMLLCGIINELQKSIPKTDSISYFFCQATDSRINNATAVLRGLIYLLVNQQPSLILHIRKKYDHAGKTLFEDANAWVTLSEIFTSILQDPSLSSTYLVVDALDECVEDLPKLLDFIVLKSSVSPQIKWLVSSRNWPDIEERLERAGHRVGLCLELNAASVSSAVSIYVEYRVSQLTQQKKYDKKTRDAVQDYLVSNANDTFLWVALVCGNLANMYGWETLTKLNVFPAGLNSLYQRMMDQIFNSTYANLCKRILATIAIIYRPITLKELTSLVEMPEEMPGEMLEDMIDNPESLGQIIGLCGSFLTIRGEIIYFVHQSAKDYLLNHAIKEIFPSGKRGAHYIVFSKSLQAMSKTLQRDVYGLRLPGISIHLIRAPKTDPLAVLGYSCVYWPSHFDEAYNSSTPNDSDLQSDLTDSGKIYQFLQNHFLHWLEALSLMKEISMGVLAVLGLESYHLAGTSPNLNAFIYDAKRFILYNRSIIEQAPLQLYYSALLFAPEKSIVRKQFEKNIPTWIKRKPKRQENWSSTLQTLEGHSSNVSSVAFSPDGKVLASGSYDKTVRLWDAGTGAALQTLEGHSRTVSSVTFWDDIIAVAPQSLQGTISSQARVDVKADWVTVNGQETLWLPPDYRPGEVAIYNCVIAIGCRSGHVLFLQFYPN